MEKNIIIQKLKKKEDSPIEKAIRYYTILSAINDLQLTKREIQLIAFTSLKGNISYSTNRDEFCVTFDSSPATINNIISKLRKENILIKESSKTKVNPAILLDFEKDIIMQIHLATGWSK